MGVTTERERVKTERERQNEKGWRHQLAPSLIRSCWSAEVWCATVPRAYEFSTTVNRSFRHKERHKERTSVRHKTCHVDTQQNTFVANLKNGGVLFLNILF